MSEANQFSPEFTQGRVILPCGLDFIPDLNYKFRMKVEALPQGTSRAEEALKKLALSPKDDTRLLVELFKKHTGHHRIGRSGLIAGDVDFKQPEYGELQNTLSLVLNTQTDPINLAFYAGAHSVTRLLEDGKDSRLKPVFIVGAEKPLDNDVVLKFNERLVPGTLLMEWIPDFMKDMHIASKNQFFGRPLFSKPLDLNSLYPNS